MAARFLEAGEISALVPMPKLLSALGFQVSVRTRRGRCPIPSHAHNYPSSPTAFSWRDDGRWFCFSRNDGGDRISLVMAVNACMFRQAVAFLASLAGVEYRRTLLSRPDFERARREKRSLHRDAQKVLALEHKAWRKAQDDLHGLEAIRRSANGRLTAIRWGGPERFTGEEELCWQALAEVYRQLPRAAVRYQAISFAPAKKRFLYAVNSQELEAAVNEGMDDGVLL